MISRCFWVLAVSGIVFAAADSAAAGSLTCPGTQITTDREHTLTLSGLAVPLGCVTGSGPNDLSGSAPHDIFVTAGWTFLDKDEAGDGGSGAIPENSFTVNVGGSTAHFDIAASAWASFAEMAIGFKVGQTSPTWAVFYLPYLTLSGDWSTIPTSGGGGLSHVTLYGKQGTPPPPPPAVPEPASLLLLGSGLAATAAKLRRRKTV